MKIINNLDIKHIFSFVFRFFFMPKLPLTADPQSYYWMGTWQDTAILPTPELFESKGRHLKYMVYQQEKAPTTGKLHFQCYFEFQKRTRLNTLKKQFPHCYWENRRGTAREAINYCTKLESRVTEPVFFGKASGDYDEIPTEMGVHQTPGEKRKRTSALQMIVNDMVKYSKTPNDIAREHPDVFVRHSNGLQKLATILQPSRNDKTTVFVYYGIPESGKSRSAWELAREYYNEEDIYSYDKMAISGQEWWQNYNNQKCVIIDEYNGSVLSWERLLKLLDRYPVYVPYKGGSSSFNAEMLIITSNYPPSSWYPNNDFRALRRRIWQAKEMKLVLDEFGPNNEPVFEPVLNFEEMHAPDQKEHNIWLRNQAIKENMTMLKKDKIHFVPDIPLNIISEEEFLEDTTQDDIEVLEIVGFD